MFLKSDIKELLECTVDTNLIMMINYEGFIGKGINGVMNNIMNVGDLGNKSKVVNKRKNRDDFYETVIVDLVIADNYIKAKYVEYYKNEYTKEFRRNNEYILVVPFDRITSIKIIAI